MKSSRIYPALLLAAGVAGVLHLSTRAQGSATSAGTFAPDPGARTTGIPISALPFTIDSCGKYFLTHCLTGSAGADGITIDADDVTLDLNGFSLQGVPGSLDGIHVNGSRANVTIRGGSIRNWDGDGVDTDSPLTTGVQLRDLHIFGNGGDGIRMGSACTAIGCNVLGNSGDGFSVNGAGCLIQDCVSGGNLHGFRTFVAGSSVQRSVAAANVASGIVTLGASVVDCVSVDSVTADGIFAIESTVSGCLARGNFGNGVTYNDSLVRGNSAVNNGTSYNAVGLPSTFVENH